MITIAAKDEEGNVSGGEKCLGNEERCLDASRCGPKMGRKGGTPPMFFVECASAGRSMSCGCAENKCVQAVEKMAVNWGCCSKRRAEFIYEYNVGASTCQ